MEGQHLHIAVAGTQQPGLPALASAEVQAAHADIAAEGAELRPVPDPPLVLYCIQANVLQAEKLRPMFSTPDVRSPSALPPLCRDFQRRPIRRRLHWRLPERSTNCVCNHLALFPASMRLINSEVYLHIVPEVTAECGVRFVSLQMDV